MKRAIAVSIALGILMVMGAPNVQALTIDCYPTADWYNTGTVTNSFVITDSSEIWEVGTDTYRGWSKFDISAILDGSTINSVTLHLYFNAINWPWFYWYRLDRDPLNLIGNPAALYADCGDGAQYLHYSGSSLPAGWYSHSLGGTAVADLQGALTVDWFGIGHKTGDSSPTYYYHADGWNEANPPYLTVDYTPSVPYGVEVTPEIHTGMGIANSNEDHTFTVNNFGTNDDVYDLDVSGHSWPTEIYDATGTTIIDTLVVTAGNTADCIVRVSIPAGTAAGESDTTSLVVTSHGDPTVADTSTAITIVSSGIIANGDFETGDFTGWTVTGPHVANVIQHQGSWCGHIHINAGSASNSSTPNNMYQMVSQEITILGANDSLEFDMEVSGSNWHNGGKVWLEYNGSYEQLFYTGSGGGSAAYYPWETHTVSLGQWAGMTVIISFSGHNSNGFGDHVCDIYFDNIEYIAGEPDTIPPEVTVNVPNGGEVWLVGDEQEILWTANDNVGVNIDSVFYSTNNGSTWEFIATHFGNPQSHTWTIPNTPSDECLMKVVVYDGSGNSDEDISDAAFTIALDQVPPTITLFAPNGGESLPTGGWFNIQWEADDNVGVVGDTVFLSIDGGANWEVVIVQSGNPENYNWNLPNSPSTQCKIKVVVFDACGNVEEDESDNVFEIYYQPPPPVTYAVVIKQSTYSNPDWAAVADALLQRYQGQLFVWNLSLFEVQNAVGLYHPTHIGFVCEPLTASASFVQNSVWPFSRGLDADPYGDAIWGIITGYTAEDALRISTASGFAAKTMLGGTGSADAYYYPQGINTNEATYGQYSVKVVDSLGTVSYTNGPTDRTEWLMTMINEGIEMFNYDPVDIFVTSGHGNHDQWQLHYPTSGLEGFFRSSNGQLYGDPYSGVNINANSVNPKIYFALGNCYVGKIQSMSSMAPAWIHTGGALLVTGYVITEGSNSHQHGGTKAFFHRQGLYTWPEAFFLANQDLYFDIQNGTPGANPPDLNGSALYGDPALDARLDVSSGVIPGSLYSENIEVTPGVGVDTVRITIVMNRGGSPGYTGKWGFRHPTVLFPFRAYDVNVLSHNCLSVVVMDNFALMYVWHQGMGEFPAGTTWELMFTCSPTSAGELSVELTPYNPPIVIPEAGGEFDFNIAVHNTISTPQTFDIWTYATLPNGNPVGPLLLVEDLTVAGNISVDRDRTQAVPAGAPGGTYYYHACIGTYPHVVTSSDLFDFEKVGDGEGVNGLSMIGSVTARISRICLCRRVKYLIHILSRRLIPIHSILRLVLNSACRMTVRSISRYTTCWDRRSAPCLTASRLQESIP